MRYQITQIDFDLSTDEPLPAHTLAALDAELHATYVGQIYDVDDPDEELADCVSNESGWSILNLFYEVAE